MMATAVKERTLDEIFSSSDVPLKERLAEAEELIKGSEHVYDFGLGDDFSRFPSVDAELVSHLFVKEITPFGFHMQSVVYSIVKDSETKETKHVLNRVYELEYNLRDKYTLLKKNGRELKFSENNIRNMFAGVSNKAVIEKLDELSDTKMYSDVYEGLGAVGYEKRKQVARFLERFMSLHVIELIYKSGVPREFSKEVIRSVGRVASNGYSDTLDSHWLNLRETSPTKVLGVPKSIFKLICQGVITYNNLNSLYNEIKTVQRSTLMRRPDSVWDNEHYRWVYPEEAPEEVAKREHHNKKQKKRNKQGVARAYGVIYALYKYALELDEEYGLDKARDIILNESYSIFCREINPKRIDNLQREESVCIAYSLGLDLNRVIRYVYYQLHVEQGFTRAGFNSTYRDYLRMMKQLNLHVVNFPKALKTAHDVAVMNMEVVKDERLAKEFAQRTETYKFWEDTKVRGSEFIMIIPDTVDDLAKEGSSLHHCVFSYARQVANGETNILFMRHKDNPDTSLVTVEIRYNAMEDRYKVIQARGMLNRALSKEEEEFLQKWCKKVGNVDRK